MANVWHSVAAQVMQPSHIGTLQRDGPPWGTPHAQGGEAFCAFAVHALRKALRGIDPLGAE